MPIVELEANRWFLTINGELTLVAEAMVFYNDRNRRLTTIQWEIFENSVQALPKIYIDDVLRWEPPNGAPLTMGAGSENIPGNLRAQLYTDSPPDYYGIPDNVRVEVPMWTVPQVG